MHFMSGGARAAAHYPAKCCRALCKGMKRQAKVDASGMLSTLITAGWHDEIGEVSHVPKPWKKYWDDISGKELKPDLVRAAREEELKVVDEMGVWELRPISECLEVTGKKPVKVRWVDVNKGDDDSPNVRCRIVAKDFNIDKRPDLFAANPPLRVSPVHCVEMRVISDGTQEDKAHGSGRQEGILSRPCNQTCLCRVTTRMGPAWGVS